MKRLNKYLLAFIMMLGVWVGFTACNESVDYSSADVPGNAQVYFSKDESSVVSLTTDQASFTIPVQRINTNGSLVVELTSIDENGIFNIPSSVTFADGASTAEITVTYNFSSIEPNKTYPITLTIGNDATEYGASVFNFNVLYAPWSDWEELGEGTYTYDGWIGGVGTHMIYRKQSLINPDLFQFKIEKWMGNDVDFIFNYDKATGQVKVDSQIYIGDDHKDYGPVYVSDAVYALGTLFGKPGFTYDDYPCTFNEETGLFTFTLAYYVGDGWFGYEFVETLQLPGYTAYDYSMTLEFGGHYVSKENVDNAIVQIKKGADIAGCKYVLVEGRITDADAEAIKESILAGTIESVEEKEGDSPHKIFPLTKMGYYAVVAVGFDKVGEAKAVGYTNFEFMPVGMTNPWVSLGYCQYTEGAVSDMYYAQTEGDLLITYSVEILENKEQPGLFRLKNAYGAGYPYNEPGDYREEDVYIEINAVDHDGVYIENQLMGFDWGDGEFGLYSLAANFLDTGKTLEEAKSAGVCGTYKDGVITFPAETLFMTLGSSAFSVNKSGLWKVDMTNLSKETASISHSVKSLKKAKRNPVILSSLKSSVYSVMNIKGKSVTLENGYGLNLTKN